MKRTWDTDPYMSIAQVAAWAGEAESKVRLRVRAKAIPSIRIGGRGSAIRIREADAARFYGLSLPGPRTLEIAHDEALAEDARWEARRPTREAQQAAAEARANDQWLNRLYDADGHLLYVGITNQCVDRFDQHGRERLWWREVRTIEVEHFDTREEVEERERELIRTSMPRYNAALNPLGRAEVVA